MRKLSYILTLLFLFLSSFAMAQTLSVTQSGTGNSATLSVTSSGQFKLVFEAADNWGLSGFYDLFNDPTETTNLASPVYGVNGPSVPCIAEDGLAQYVFYSEGDEKQFIHEMGSGCAYASSTPTMTVVTNTSQLVELRVTAIPAAPSQISTDLTTTITYDITPDGKIYVHDNIKALSAFNFSGSDDYVMMFGLPDSLQTGTIFPDSQSVGWVRASATQNPYNYVNGPEKYVYTYWGSSSGAFGYGSTMTPKASLMIVPSPNNTVTLNGQLQHSWACGTGCGVVRWGYHTTNGPNLTAGQSVSYDWLIQLGTQGSTVLPDMTVAPPSNCSSCETIANAYIADPTPPTGGGGQPSGALLTGMTPWSNTLPSGWTLFAEDNFETGSYSTSAYGNGNFVTNNYHNDGNATDTKSIECQVGIADCNGNVSWNRALPVGTKQVYVSWYEYLDPSFAMNDEMFLMRFHWDTGNGQPSFREAILDYFQDSTNTYNSSDATLLWNIQGQPYYQNRLPGNTVTDRTNFPIATGQWVQHEVYVQFSTVSSTMSITGTVTFDATNHTYTRSQGSWITDGVKVGDSPHFTGFTNSWNNGAGTQGGGGDSYFVTAVTDTTMTVTADPYGSTTTETVTNPTYQVDHGDGAYQYYKNGTLVASQSNMVFPGGVDFSTQQTTLSIGESYTKNIWHTGSETTAPFTSPCSTDMTGTGYDNLAGLFGVSQYGWNGNGWTSSTSGGAWDTHIPCDATWGGPMPTPPVFKRYLDDVMVLTQDTYANGSGGGSSGSGTVSTTVNGSVTVTGATIN